MDDGGTIPDDVLMAEFPKLVKQQTEEEKKIEADEIEQKEVMRKYEN